MHKISRIALYITLCIACVEFSSDAFAQSLPTAQGNRLEQQIKPSLSEPQSKPVVPQLAPAIPESVDKAEGIFVKQIAFEGAFVTAPLLSASTGDVTGKVYDSAGLETLAQFFTNVLRNEGYILSFVTISEQTIVDGRLLLKVHERGLSRVIFEGDMAVVNASYREAWQNTLVQDVPLQRSTLERVLLTINDVAGLTASSTLFQDKENDGVGLKIEIERDRLSAFSSLDNRGSNFIGPWQVSLSGSYNGITSAFDELRVRGFHGTDNQELQGIEAGYETLVRDDGTMLTLDALRIWSEPGFTLKDNRFENIISRLSARVSHPLIKQRQQRFDIFSQFTMRNSQSKAAGDYLSDDRIRSLSAGIQLDRIDAWAGASLANIQLHQGLDILDARESGSSLLSRANGRSDFSKVTTSLSRLQNVDEDVNVLFVLEGQYAFTQLLSSEEFGFGGAQLGRGYDPSEIVGDHGVAGMIEFRYNIQIPQEDIDIILVQFYTSYDIGAVWAIDSKNRFDRQTAASGALGIRINVTDKHTLDVQLAKPFTRTVSAFSGESGNDPRGFLSITSRF